MGHGTSVAISAPTYSDEERVAYEGEGPWFACLPDAHVDPRVAKAGIAGPTTEPQTIMDLFVKAHAKHGAKPALLAERPLPMIVDKVVPPALPRGQWKTWTWADYHDEVRQVAMAFIELGMKPHESVNVWGFNAPEWMIAGLAGMHAGGKCAGLYPTDTPDAAAYKVVHSGGSVVVCDDRKKVVTLAKALGERKDCKRLTTFVLYLAEAADGDSIEVEGLGSVPIIGWDALVAKGKNGGKEAELETRIKDTKPGHCASLIYTSGTTGEPKAVMISHDQFIFEAKASFDVMERTAGIGLAGEERVLSYLPLSHVAGMMLDVIAPLAMTSAKPAHSAVFFARPYDLKEKVIKDRLNICKPTIFLGVPLVWEKIADQIRAIGATQSATTMKIAGAAKGIGLEKLKNRQLGGTGAIPWGYSGSKAVVLSKVKRALGLDQLKVGLTGAAPIRVDTIEYFASLGLQINEAYGMSESTGVATISSKAYYQWGSCGPELPGCEVKVFLCDPTDFNQKTECERSPDLESIEEKYQGELCYRGRNIMMGYMACPDMGPEHVQEITKKNAETIDKEGWLHSGDKGMMTAAGMVKITGRYKELIIGEGGENIAPVPIEDQVKKACDGIAEVMMIGDKRKYNVALVTLKAVGANGEVPGTDVLDAGAKRVSGASKKISEAMDDEVWIEAVRAAVKAANSNGKCCPNNAFKIQKFCILPTNFSEEGGELTPTKKLKRSAAVAKFAPIIEKLYAQEGDYIRYSE